MTREVRLFRPEYAGAVAAPCAALNAEQGYNRGAVPGPDEFRARFLGPSAAGDLLVAGAARRVRARGGCALWWTSRPHNARAAALYAALGACSAAMRAHARTFDAFDRLAEWGGA